MLRPLWTMSFFLVSLACADAAASGMPAAVRALGRATVGRTAMLVRPVPHAIAHAPSGEVPLDPLLRPRVRRLSQIDLNANEPIRRGTVGGEIWSYPARSNFDPSCGSLAWYVRGLPAGTSGSFSPPTTSFTGSTTLSISVSATAPFGVVTTSIGATCTGANPHGNAPGPNAWTVGVYDIPPAPSIAGANSATIAPGDSYVYRLDDTATSAFGTLDWALPYAAPMNATLAFGTTQTSAPPHTNTLVLQTSKSTPTGNYAFGASVDSPTAYGGSDPTIIYVGVYPACTIASQTEATSPSNRMRTTVGVGEIVDLSDNASDGTWQLSGPGSLSGTSGSSIKFTAGSSAGTATIAVTAGACSKHTIAINVIRPTGVKAVRFSGSGVQHTLGRADIGMKLALYLQPDTVSFKYVKFSESDAPCACTGVYAPFNGQGFHPSTTPSIVGDDVPGLGSLVQGYGIVYSRDPGGAAPFKPGSEIFNIPANFVYGTTSVRFATEVSNATLASNATSLSLSKASASATTTVPSPSSHY